MITIAHISDIHLAPLPRVRMRDLMSKRFTGYLNWQLSRAKMMRPDTLANLIDHMCEQNPDVTAVTGDLVNLALDNEVERAAQWLETLGSSDVVCAVPGNHDAYVRGALNKARRVYGAYMAGETLDKNPFPYVRRIGDVALIGCSSAIPTPPFVAAGQVHSGQVERLGKLLDMLGEAGYFRVVMVHHPPNEEQATSRRLGMWKAGRFRRTIAEHVAELVLHGHTHVSSIHGIPGPTREVPVVGVAAASAAPEGHDAPGRYNLFRIEKIGSEWSCSMREYGYQRIGDEIALRLQMRIY
jgi:3',5'-cyclic AMP phosphodiesterase CpdA